MPHFVVDTIFLVAADDQRCAGLDLVVCWHSAGVLPHHLFQALVAVAVVGEDGGFGVHAFAFGHEFGPFGQDAAQFVALDVDEHVYAGEVRFQEDLLRHIDDTFEVKAVEGFAL